jgi:transcription elongation factor Elf1
MVYKGQFDNTLFTCQICGEDFKPTSARQKFCISCKDENRRQWAVENRKTWSEQKRLYYQNKRNKLRNKFRIEIKDYVIKYKENNPCVICGESDLRCLQFHHKDAYTKRKTISELIRHGSSLNRLKEEINLCDVLCANCHLKIHYDMRGINKSDTTKEEYNPEY